MNDKFVNTNLGSIPYKVVRSGRNKRISMNISENGIRISTPKRIPNYVAEKFLNENIEWIEKNYIQYRHEKYRKMKHGESFTILSELFEVEHNYSDSLSVKELDGKFIVDTKIIDSLESRAHLSKYIRKRYGKLIKSRVEELAESNGFNFERISIRDQSSRWGSCSSKKNLNFNWRLLFAPIEILDYVIIHELSHTVHMNHSKDFWDLVGKHDENYKENKRWLKNNRRNLLEY